MNIVEILTNVLLISASVLCIALIYFFNKIEKSVHSFSLNVQRVSIKLIPFIESTLKLSERSVQITNGIESQLQISKSIVIDIRNLTDKLLTAENMIRLKIENTVEPLVKNYRAFGKGVESFWRNYKSR